MTIIDCRHTTIPYSVPAGLTTPQGESFFQVSTSKLSLPRKSVSMVASIKAISALVDAFRGQANTSLMTEPPGSRQTP
jgi:hypothetical protein